MATAEELPLELLVRIVAFVVTAGAGVMPSLSELVSLALVCKQWSRVMHSSSELWEVLLRLRWPSHPAARPPGSALSDSGAYFRAYSEAARGLSLAGAQHARRSAVPLAVLSAGGRGAGRVRLATVCTRDSHLVALQSGRLHIARLEAAADPAYSTAVPGSDGAQGQSQASERWLQQVLPDARTDRLAGVALCTLHDGAQAERGSAPRDALLATASNPWPGRKGSVIEVWAVRLARLGEGPLGAGGGAERVGCFGQEGSVSALALAPAYRSPTESATSALLATAVKNARGCQLSVRRLSLEATPPGSGGGSGKPSAAVSSASLPDHHLAAMAWCRPGGCGDGGGAAAAAAAGDAVLFGATVKGVLLSWHVSAGGGGALRARRAASPALHPRPRALWSARSHPQAASLAVIGDLGAGGSAVYVTASAAPASDPALASWTALPTVRGVGGEAVQPADACWVGESLAVVYRDGGIRLFGPATGTCIGTVFMPDRHQYLERAQIDTAAGPFSWPPALLTVAKSNQSTEIHLIKPLA
eukprot:jgi/Tetstr1/462109/TSEL_007177.t1